MAFLIGCRVVVPGARPTPLLDLFDWAGRLRHCSICDSTIRCYRPLRCHRKNNNHVRNIQSVATDNADSY